MSFYTLRNGNAFEVQKHILERKSYVSRKNSSKRKKKKKKKEKTKLTFMRHLYVYVSTYIYASTCAYLIIHTYICLARDRLAINFVRRKPHAHKCQINCIFVGRLNKTCNDVHNNTYIYIHIYEKKNQFHDTTRACRHCVCVGYLRYHLSKRNNRN